MNKQLRICVLGLICALGSAGAQAQTSFAERHVRKGLVPVETKKDVSVQSRLLPNQRDSVVTTTVTMYRTYNDTVVTTITTQDVDATYDTIITPAPESYHKGHYLQAYIGGGYSSLGYKLREGSVTGGAQAMVQLQYAYFFNHYWGIGIGASVSNLTSHARPEGSHVWNGVPDSDGEIHNHTVRISNWNERQTLHAIDLPVSVQFQHFYDKGKGVFFDLGAAPQLTLESLNRYNVTSGELEHSAFYEWSNLTLTDMHEFGVQDGRNKGNMAARQLSAAAFADLGLLFTVSKNLDIYAGVYGYCNLLNANVSEKEEVGWKTDMYPYMNEYKSIYSSSDAGKSYPWAVGVKVGLHLHQVPKEKIRIVEHLQPITEMKEKRSVVVRKDTVAQVSSDTVYALVVTDSRRAGARKAVGAADVAFRHIYFDINKADIREDNLENMNNILRYLKEHPECGLVLTGHACRLGDSGYNDALSRRRATAAARWFKERGIEASRIETRHFGSSQPSSTETHQLKLDRRVEVNVTK